MKHYSALTARYAITILLMGGLCLSFGRGVFAANGISQVIMFQGKVTNSNGTNVADGAYDFEFKLYDAAGAGSTLFTETWSSAALWSSTMSSAPGNGGTQLTYSTGTNESTIKVGQILWNTTKQESVIVTAVDTGANTVDISPTRQAWAGSDTVTNRIYVKDGVFRVALNSLNTSLSGVNFGTNNIFLGVNFNADGEMKPRIQYSAVPYAFNAEKVNGLTVTNTSNNPFGSTTTLKIEDGKTVSFSGSISLSGTDSTAFTLPSGSDTLVGLTATQSLTNKTIGSTGLVFNGATTDITSFTNEDLTVTPNGSGSLVLTSDFDSGVKIGSSTNPLAGLSISSGIGSNASLIVNQLLSGDLFVASQGGTTKFAVTNSGGVQLTAGQGIDALSSGALLLGNGATTTSLTIGRSGAGITLPGFSSQNGVLYGTNGSGLLAQATTASTGLCLISTASNPSWGSCSGTPVVSVWDLYDGALRPAQASVVDLLLGGTSTASAKFAFINTLTGNPTASISAQNVGGQALVLGADGTVQTTRNSQLVIGGATTGNIVLSPLNSIAGSRVTPGADNLVSLGASASARFKDLFVGPSSLHIQCLTGDSCGQNLDYALGVNTANNGFYIGANGITGALNQLFTISEGGNVGIGTTNPASRLDVAFPTLTAASANGVNISGTLANGVSGVQNGLNVNVTAAPTATFVTSTGIKVNMTDATGIASTDQGLNIAITSTPGAFVKTITGADITLTDDGTVNGTVQGLNISANRSGQHAGSSGNIKGLTLTATSTGTSTSGLDTVAGLEVNAGASNGNGSAQTIYGLRVKQAANTVTSGTITYYGVHIANQTMDTTGTSAQTGLFVGNITGADTNYAAIFAGGKIGMGTTTPESLLHLTGASVGNALLTLNETGLDQNLITASASGVTKFTLGQDGSASMSGNLTLGNAGVLRSSAGELNLAYKSGQNAWTTGLTLLDNSGNVGIGTTNPTSRLHVASSSIGNALVTLNEQGNTQDIFTASSGGLTKFVINNNGNVGIGTSTPTKALLDIFSTLGTLPAASISAKSSFAGLIITQNGSGDILSASDGGTTRFSVARSGAVDINTAAAGLTINSSGTTDIHKTTSNNNQIDTDFQRTANSTSATLTNITAANGDLSLDSGAVSGDGTITTGSQPATPGALGAGAHSISRPDGKYLVIRGGATTLYIYDTLANTFSTSSQVLNNAAGAGALAIPRADGKYLVIHGGGATTNSIVDPMGNSAVGASVVSNAMGAGTNAFRRQNGRYLILNGGAGTTQIPDVTVSTGATIWTSGPAAASGTWGAGSLVLPRPDGSALIVNGGATATTNLYTPWSGAASIGVFAAGPVLPVGCEINGAGSVAIQKADGRYIILSKAGVSVEYDPVTNTMGACQAVGPANALADGAHVIRLQDRRFLILRGSGTTNAYIYNPETNTYSTHATPTSTQGAGLHSIQKSDGTWQILVGGATTTNNYNTQLVMSGSYTSEDFTTTSLNINSSLLWTIGAESLFVGTSSATTNTPQSGVEFMVRTASTQGGLSSATDIPIKRSGDLIQATGTAAWARVTINFTRPIPSPIYDDTRRVWLGNGMTNMIRDYQSPTVFDYTIDNSTVLRRNIFDFSNSQLNTDPTEASPSALTRVRGQTNGLVLPPGEVPGNGVTTTTGLIGASGFNSGKPGPHPTTLQATGDGTIVMARPGGMFAVIASGSANLSLYDSASSQFIAQSGAGNIPTASAGAGAFALKLPNGKFLIIFGNFTGAGQTTTNIYDPNAGSGSRFIAGPTLSAAAGAGAQAIQNTDGTYTIIHGGGATTSSLFNPFTDLTKGTATLPAGPTLTTAANCGAWAIPLQGQYQGKYRVAVGAAANVAASTVSMMYDAVTKTFTAGQALTNGAGCGGMVFQRQDGYWISITGGSNVAAGSTTTNIINPFAGSNAASTSTLAGPTVTALHRGVFVIPRPDGTFLIGGQSAWNTNSTALQVYFPWGSTMGIGAPIGYTIALTAVLNNAAGSGAVTFQRPDGKWVIINGGATVGSNLVNIYDAGWFADGQYLSGQMKVPQLTSTSALTWKKTVDDSISMEVRTAPSRVALLSEDYRDINPSDANMRITPGDQWLQMQINFSRKFPTYDGVNTDVWTSGGAKNYLTIPVPTLLEYKITNDSDLLNLKSGGQAIFRVNGSGNIYAGQQGGFFTSGADLAENYTSSESLMPGEVVSIDSTDNKSVKRTKSQYQKDVLGVVSTDPGFVAGAYTENSYPIALVGRVPVKVSTENGDIKAGDVLTSSSIPGYAMKAQVAGRVIGRVLEDLRVENEHACPHEGFGVAPENRCGTVMLFVNLVDYQGGSVEMVMDEMGARKDVGAEELGLQIASVSSDETGLESTGVFMATPERVTQRQLNTLAFLKDLRAKGSGSLSEIFTDRISAAHEIVTPQIIADTIIARKIKAQSIEGMEFVYGLKDQDSRIKDLESLFASSSAHLSTKSASTSGVISSEVKQELAFNEVSKTSLTLRDDPLLTLNSLSVEGLATVSADLRVKNNSLIEGILSVIDTITTKRLVVFDLATFFGDVLFKKDVTFEGKVTFEKDAAGYAVIKKGTQKVDVTFDGPYGHSPIVTASLDLDIYKDEKGKDEDQEASSERILNENYTYVIAKKSEKGFTIILNKKATDDIRFSWSAVQIPNEEKKNEHDIMSSLFFDTNSTPTTFSPE